MKNLLMAVLTTFTLAILLLLFYHDKRSLPHYEKACSDYPEKHLVEIFNDYRLMYSADTYKKIGTLFDSENASFSIKSVAQTEANKEQKSLPKIKLIIQDPLPPMKDATGTGSELTYEGNDYCLKAHKDGVIELFLNGVTVNNHNTNEDNASIHFLKLIFALREERVLVTYHVGHSASVSHNHANANAHNRSHGAAISLHEDSK